jgi:hypothetical protein
MIMAETGLVPKVPGNNIAIAPVGPMPGKTPMSVPIRTPIKQYRKLMGVEIVEKPFKRPSKISILKIAYVKRVKTLSGADTATKIQK